MAVKNNRRTILTKRILKETLLELLLTKPISKITIKEICDVSDMSRSTFYHHYYDQYDLLKDIENEALSNTFEMFENLDTELITKESIILFLEYVKSNKDIFEIFLCRPENHSFQQAIINNIQKHLQTKLPPLIEQHKEQYLYSFIMNGSLSVITDWIKNNFTISAQELSEILFKSCSNIAIK